MYAPSFTAVDHLVCISYLSYFSTENSSLDWKEKVSKQISQRAFGPPFLSRWSVPPEHFEIALLPFLVFNETYGQTHDSVETKRQSLNMLRWQLAYLCELLQKNLTNGSSRWTEGRKLNVRMCERPKVKVNEPGDFLRSVGVLCCSLNWGLFLIWCIFLNFK